MPLGRVHGVPVVVSPSWLVIGGLLTFLYGPVIDGATTTVTGAGAYAAALGFSLVFALCILAHELGHTVVSIALGYPVKRVVLFVLGGVSEIEGEPARARHELVIAASGPLVSTIVAAGAFAGLLATGVGSLPHVLFFLLAWSNIVLAIFNLLPGLPLDGGRILRAVAWGVGASSVTSMRIAAWSGRVFALVVAAGGVALNVSAGSSAAAIMSLLLAGYLWISATQSLRLAELRGRLPNIDVGSLLRPGLMIPSDISVAEALRRVWESGARGLVLVDDADRPQAIVQEKLIGAVPPPQRPWTPVTSVAAPVEGRTLPAGVDADALFQHMQDHPAPEYLVLDPAGRPQGIVATADFAALLRGPRR